MKNLRFFLDFDGTISTIDAVDVILERFASPEWRKIEDEWQSGSIGSRECLTRQIALVSANPGDFEALLREIPVDPHFTSFLRKAHELSVPVAIVSDGFDVVIRNILERTLNGDGGFLKTLPVFSNKLVWGVGARRAVPLPIFSADSCGHGCANCKARVIERERREGETVVFVGDGLSDGYAAQIADLTFAKSKLEAFCKKNQLPYKSYSDFRDIENWMTEKAR